MVITSTGSSMLLSDHGWLTTSRSGRGLHSVLRSAVKRTQLIEPYYCSISGRQLHKVVEIIKSSTTGKKKAILLTKHMPSGVTQTFLYRRFKTLHEYCRPSASLTIVAPSHPLCITGSWYFAVCRIHTTKTLIHTAKNAFAVSCTIAVGRGSGHTTKSAFVVD